MDNNATPLEVARDEVGTRLLFENEVIRVWDLSLAPGESLPKHVHRLPFCFIVAQGGHLQHAEPGRPETARDVNYEDNLVVYSDPTTQEGGEAVHLRLTNVGDAPYQNYVIEFKLGGNTL
jgi:hypothetical protein